MKGQEYFLARQPILNERQTLVAYELLFRNSTENHAVIADDMSASMAVIQHAFLTLGVNTALNGKPAFINISEDLLLSDLLAAGFTLFQGYYFARPTMIQGRSLSPSAMQLLKLLKLIVSDAEIEQIEDEIKKAPEFMVRMMRLANSSSYFKLEKLRTPRQAILLLGRLQLSRLVQIMMFMREESESWTADPLAQAAIVRGRLIEELLEHSQQHTLKPYGFMLGMFSLSAVLFGVELETIIKILELDGIMKAALLHREGRLGELLTLVEAAEQADGPEGMTAFQTQLETLNICDVSAFNRMQVDALRWAGQM